MAKLTIEYDTKTKLAAVRMDGEPVENFHGLQLARSYGEKEGEEPQCYMDLHQREQDKENGTYSVHHTMAAERVPAGVKAADSGLEGHKVVTTVKASRREKPDFTKAGKDVVSWFTRED